MKKRALKLLEYDPYLMPFEKDITLRVDNYKKKKAQLLGNCRCLSDFANGHLFYGFHKDKDGWIYREWAPNADSLFLIGDFNGWNRKSHPMKNIGNGNFEIYLQGQNVLAHGMQVKVHICANGESFDRIPLYIKRVVQLSDKSFNGEIWNPVKQFQWADNGFRKNDNTPLFIYECHIGIASEQYHVSSFNHFTNNVLPRIFHAGYNAIQLMAIMEHPYYGSFGYQVSNFFAVSSRFGTPDDLKNLINTAHSMGIAVFLDIVHSHAACNILEGIGKFDGTVYQFFHNGDKGNHPTWGTKLFNYDKPEVIHFLLSNIKFWLDEYHFDGFRFDGITSMLYHDHGLGSAFCDYHKYFSMNTDTKAITYLQLAADLSKEINPDCVLIAEDMSGMPGMCVPIADGGIGFDYRLSMGVPDFWIRTLRDKRDEEWDLGQLWHELTQRRPNEKVICYCESHDQALVGDKTIVFWLADKEMYWHMSKNSHSYIIDRAMALHKMIRLITCSCAGDGYLNFMGNEFGHPEWIDFPREGNGWSYHYARRQWSLADNSSLRYQYLLAFDKVMIAVLKGIINLSTQLIIHDENAKVLVFSKGNHLFAFNFHPTKEYFANIFLDTHVCCEIVLHSDWIMFGGHSENGNDYYFELKKEDMGTRLTFALSNRVALVFKYS